MKIEQIMDQYYNDDALLFAEEGFREAHNNNNKELALCYAYISDLLRQLIDIEEKEE